MKTLEKAIAGHAGPANCWRTIWSIMLIHTQRRALMRPWTLLPAVLVVACGTTIPPVGPSALMGAATSALSPIQAPTFGLRTVYDCPSEAPVFHIGTAGALASFDATAIVNAAHYETQALEDGYTIPITTSSDTTHVEMQLPADHYEGRMRQINVCGLTGDWSAYQSFTVSGQGTTPPPSVTDPPLPKPVPRPKFPIPCGPGCVPKPRLPLP